MPDNQAPPAPSWRDTLPDDIKGDPSLATIPDTGALAKSFLEARKYIGKDPKSFVSLPDKPDAPEWGAVYDRLGRPPSPDKYTPVDKALWEKAGIAPEVLTEFLPVFHKFGVTDAAAQGILSHYANMTVKGQEIQGQQSAAQEAKNKEEVAKLLGANSEAKLAMVGAFIDQNGGEAMVKLAQEKGLVGHPVFLDFLLKQASATMEHKNHIGSGGGSATPVDSAKAEIESIKQKRIDDPTYNAAFQNNPNHPDRIRWSQLHTIAFPNQPKPQ